MTTSLVFPVILSLAFAGAALAQEAPAPTSPPAAVAAAPGDCARPMARHDHGAERLTPSPKAAAPCAPAKTRTSAKAKVGPGHDHGKFHKNQ